MRHLIFLILCTALTSCFPDDGPTMSKEQYARQADSIRFSKTLRTNFASKGDGFYEKTAQFTFLGDSVIMANIGGTTTKFSLFSKEGTLYVAYTKPSWDPGVQVQTAPFILKKDGYKPVSVKIGDYLFTNTPALTKVSTERFYIVEKDDTPTGLSKSLNIPIGRIPKNLRPGDKIAY